MGLAIAGLLLALGPAPVAAHNNRTAFVGARGPFDVVASVADVDRGPEVGLLFEVTVRTEGTRRPVADAEVTVAGVAADVRAGPLRAEGFGSTYRVVLPGRDVRSWELDITIAGSTGQARFTEVVPGPAELHGGTIVDSGSEPVTVVWALLVATVAAALGAMGLTGAWWGAVRVGSGVLLAAAATVVAGAWSASSVGAAAKAVSVVPAAVAATALAVGAVMVGRRRDDALALVFAAAGGLAVVAGWAERAALTDRYVESGLAPDLARAAVTLVLGCGAGLAVLVAVRSRSALCALLPGGEARRSRKVEG